MSGYSEFLDTVHGKVSARLVAINVAGGRVNDSKMTSENPDVSLLPAVNFYVAIEGDGKSKAQNESLFDSTEEIQLECIATGPSDTETMNNARSLGSIVMEALLSDHELCSLVQFTKYEKKMIKNVKGQDRFACQIVILTFKHEPSFPFSYPNELKSVGMAVKHNGTTISQISIQTEES